MRLKISPVLIVEKTEQFQTDLDEIVEHIAQDNPIAALDMELHVHNQVDSLGDPNFPRRRGRVAGTFELVVHPNYVVVITQTETVVTALTVMHTSRQYP